MVTYLADLVNLVKGDIMLKEKVKCPIGEGTEQRKMEFNCLN